MGNSIFDDDDNVFSLSSGFDEGEKKSTPPKGPVRATQPPARSIPESPISSQPKFPGSDKGMPVAPQQPANNHAKRANKQPLPVRNNNPLPTHQLPSSLPASLPTVSPIPTQSQPSTTQQNRNPLPSIPRQEKSFTQLPISQSIPQQEYVDEEYVDEEYVDNNSSEAIWAEDERRQDEQNEKHRIEDEARRLRQEERRAEEEHAERIKRNAEKRVAERKRLEREEEERFSNNASNFQPEQYNQVKEVPTKGKKGKKTKEVKEKVPTSFAGKRRNVLILRLIVFIVLGVFVIAGVKTTFFPTPGPTPKQVVATVKDGLGLTNFPTEQGSAFVIGFSKVYLTVQANGGGDRSKELAPYMPTNLISEQRFSQENTSETSDPQKITSGPYISGVINKDDNNAVYTIAAQVNNSTWLYIDVPTYYDNKKDAFVISGTPAFVPAPTQGDLVGQIRPWSTEDQAVGIILTDTAKQFFPAWATSNKEVMSPYITTDATTATKTGLAGIVTFVNVNSVSVEPADELSDPSKRRARVSIQWANSLVKGTTYAQVYDLELEKVADQWRIQSIVGGVTTETDK